MIDEVVNRLAQRIQNADWHELAIIKESEIGLVLDELDYQPSRSSERWEKPELIEKIFYKLCRENVSSQKLEDEIVKRLSEFSRSRPRLLERLHVQSRLTELAPWLYSGEEGERRVRNTITRRAYIRLLDIDSHFSTVQRSSKNNGKEPLKDKKDTE